MGSLLHVNPVELTWVMLNTVTLVFTLTALFDARADRAAVRLLNGRARELAASGIVRRELIRVMVQVMLLAVALPGLFTPDRNTPLNPVVAMLMAVPVLLLISSFLDARERKALTVMVTAEALVLKTDALDRIEGKLDRNTEVSAEAVIEARRAYQEANHLNEKLAAQDQQIADISEDAAATGNRIEGTVNSTAKQVDDLHEGTAPTVVS
jgi:signal transduction histidine kinase